MNVQKMNIVFQSLSEVAKIINLISVIFIKKRKIDRYQRLPAFHAQEIFLVGFYI